MWRRSGVTRAIPTAHRCATRRGRRSPAAGCTGGGGPTIPTLWSGEYLGVSAASELDLGSLEPHGIRLLSVHPRCDRPQTVGSTGHLLGEAVDLAAEEWDPVARALTLQISQSGPRDRKGECIV